MNEYIEELRRKADSILKECNDPDLNDAAFFLIEAAKKFQAYEIRMEKENHIS